MLTSVCHLLSLSICLPPAYAPPHLSPPPYSIILLFSQKYIHFRTKEPQPLADLQCEDPWSGVLHGGSVTWGHAYLDGCYCYGRWGTHAFHGVTDPKRSGFTPLNCFVCHMRRFTASSSCQCDSKYVLHRAEMDVHQVNRKLTSVYTSSIMYVVQKDNWCSKAHFIM